VIPFIPAPYLYAGLFLAGLAAGGYGVHTWHKAQRVDTIERARTSEQGFQRVARQADVRYIERLHDQAAAAQTNAKAWERAMLETNYQLAQCRVGADAVGLLNAAGMPGAAADPAQPRPGSATAAPARDSNAAAELGVCRRNYAEVCVPNAVQLEELRGFTRRLIKDYNDKIGR
jgi:hypothetical protein